jgi:hypothetical protein
MIIFQTFPTKNILYLYDISSLKKEKTLLTSLQYLTQLSVRGLRGRDRLVVGFTTTYAISTYHH